MDQWLKGSDSNKDGDISLTENKFLLQIIQAEVM